MTIKEAKRWAREIHPRLVVAPCGENYFELRLYRRGGRWRQVGVCRSMPELHTFLRGVQVGVLVPLDTR